MMLLTYLCHLSALLELAAAMLSFTFVTLSGVEGPTRLLKKLRALWRPQLPFDSAQGDKSKMKQATLK